MQRKTIHIFAQKYQLFFKIALVFTFGLLFYQCMYNESNWQSIFSDTETLIQNGKVTEIEGGIIKVYWALNGMKQDNPALIDFIKNNVLVKPDNLPLKLAKINPKHLGKMGAQYGQPYQVEDVLGLKTSKKDTKKGFFIEAGAAGGEAISNTLYFELKYGWTGLLVEPNPDELRELYSKHRKSYILPHCLSTKPEVEVVKFDVSKYVSGILVEGKQKPSRMEGDPNRPHMFYERTIEVQCFPLYSVLMALGNPHIDYFSLDIEGAELPVLKTLPWDKINMTLLDVEVNHAGVLFPGTREDIQNFLSSHNYPYTKSVKIDDIFYNKDHNRFL